MHQLTVLQPTESRTWHGISVTIPSRYIRSGQKGIQSNNQPCNCSTQQHSHLQLPINEMRSFCYELDRIYMIYTEWCKPAKIWLKLQRNLSSGRGARTCVRSATLRSTSYMDSEPLGS
jgi:hypothetical protein